MFNCRQYVISAERNNSYYFQCYIETVSLPSTMADDTWILNRLRLEFPISDEARVLPNLQTVPDTTSQFELGRVTCNARNRCGLGIKFTKNQFHYERISITWRRLRMATIVRDSGIAADEALRRFFVFPVFFFWRVSSPSSVVKGPRRKLSYKNPPSPSA